MAQEVGAHGEAPATAAAAGAGLEPPLSPPLSPATAAAAALHNARWNPTREQVTVLEGLYERGLRTPSAEQIQHVAARLREHGPVEAKNVFYWFQNHKARQRQKEKQDSFAYFTRLMRRPPQLPVIAMPPGQQPYPLGPMMPASAPPAACIIGNGGGGGTQVMYRTPYYMPAPPPQASSPANAAGYYNLQQAAHHMAAGMYPRMDIAVQDKQMQLNLGSVYQQAAPYGTSNHQLHVAVPSSANGGASAADRHAGRTRETLELFPLRPTFPLPAARDASPTSPSAPPPAAPLSRGAESESLVEEPNSNAEAPLPFYDFLGLQSAGR